MQKLQVIGITPNISLLNFSEKKRNEEASQYAILKQSLDEHKTYTIELKKLLDEEKLIYKDLQENLKQKEELQQKYSYLLTEGDDDDDLNSVTTIANSDDNVVNLSDNDFQPSSKNFKKVLSERFLEESSKEEVQDNQFQTKNEASELQKELEKINKEYIELKAKYEATVLENIEMSAKIEEMEITDLWMKIE